MVDGLRNRKFGFKCLYYKVAENAGYLQVCVLNKKKQEGSVRIVTVDAAAKSGLDFIAVDEVINFKKGEAYAFIYVRIIDDDEWEDDEDFSLVLLDPEKGK